MQLIQSNDVAIEVSLGHSTACTACTANRVVIVCVVTMSAQRVGKLAPTLHVALWNAHLTHCIADLPYEQTAAYKLSVRPNSVCGQALCAAKFCV